VGTQEKVKGEPPGKLFLRSTGLHSKKTGREKGPQKESAIKEKVLGGSPKQGLGLCKGYDYPTFMNEYHKRNKGGSPGLVPRPGGSRRNQGGRKRFQVKVPGNILME